MAHNRRQFLGTAASGAAALGLASLGSHNWLRRKAS